MYCDFDQKLSNVRKLPCQEFGPFSNYGVNGEPRKLIKRVFSISQKYSVKL